jgi:hypothetical protein
MEPLAAGIAAGVDAAPSSRLRRGDREKPRKRT